MAKLTTTGQKAESRIKIEYSRAGRQVGVGVGVLVVVLVVVVGAVVGATSSQGQWTSSQGNGPTWRRTSNSDLQERNLDLAAPSFLRRTRAMKDEM